MLYKRVVKKNKKNFSTDKNHSKSPLGVLSLSNRNLKMKNLSDERLRVYKSIFPKISRSPFGLGITYIRALRYRESDFEYENRSGMRTEGLYVDFAQNLNFSPCA